jgi:hypothetical protein
MKKAVAYKSSEMKTMNQLRNLICLFLAGMCFLFLNSCKPETDGIVGDPFDKVQGMIGTWELSQFTQQDLNSPVKEVRNLSSFFIDGISTPIQLTFNEDRSYAVAIEMGKNYFGEGGTWGFDDDLYPTFLKLYTPADTLSYNLGGMVREFDQDMRIEYRRECGTSATNIYTFEFNRING